MKLSRRGFLRSLYASSFTVAAERLAPWLPAALNPVLAEASSSRSAGFVDVASRAGLLVPNTCGPVHDKKHLLEMTGCGVAFFDYDHDGWLDLLFLNGASFRPASGAQPTNCLFRNNRDGTFTEVTANAGLIRTGWGQGCCVGDYDNDGYDDLFLTYWGQNALYRNRGDGTFEDVTVKAGLVLKERRWNTGCCFLDYDRDGYLDLFVANYIQFAPEIDPGIGGSVYCQLNGRATACGPRGFDGGTNLLYRNRGDGTFEDVTAKAGIDVPSGPRPAGFASHGWRPRGSYGFAAVAADFDDDGWPDIYVACDSAPSLLYLNNRDGTFRECGVDAGCAFNEDGREQGGMGVAAGDYDGDGRLDLIKTNFSDDTMSLYRNLGGGLFEDATARAGLAANTRYLGWGAGLVDIDNDGWKDIVLVNGHIYPEVNAWFRHLHYKDRKLVYRNLGNGRFADISDEAGPGISLERSARGCAFGDFDNDGDIDVVISNINDLPSLLRNDFKSPGTSENHWIKVKCIGVVSNRSAIGARVRVSAGGRTQIDEVQSGSSYLSQNDLRLHFGLGRAKVVDRLEVRWPNSKVETFTNLAADRIYTIIEGRGLSEARRASLRPYPASCTSATKHRNTRNCSD